jgi:ankyrin
MASVSQKQVRFEQQPDTVIENFKAPSEATHVQNCIESVCLKHLEIAQKEHSVEDLLIKEKIYEVQCFLDPERIDVYLTALKSLDTQHFQTLVDRLFLRFVKEENASVLPNLLRFGANIDVQEEITSRSALHIAASKKSIDIVKFLLEKNISCALTNREGETALHTACRVFSLDIIHLLVLKSTNLKAVTRHSYTPLHYIALQRDATSLIPIFVKKGAPVDAQDSRGWTALHIATYLGHVNMVKKLIATGADATLITNDGNNALHIAAHRNFITLVHVLSAKIDNAAVNHSGLTPLHVATCDGHIEVMEFLLRNKTIAKIPSSLGARNALHFACLSNQLGAINLLIARRFDLNVKDENGDTPLHFTCANGENYYDAAQLLLLNKADANIMNNRGETPFHLAICSGYLPTIELLKQYGAKIDMEDSKKFRPFHLAAQLGNVKIMEYLLFPQTSQNPISLGHVQREAKTDEGKTALHLACRANQSDSVAFLIQQRWDANAQDLKGNTPLHMLAGEGHYAIASFLIKKGVNLEIENCEGKRPFHVAAECGEVEMMQLLIDHKATYTALTADGQSALHLAALADQSDALSFLFKQGLNVYLKDKAGKTPLALALGKKHLFWVSLLSEYMLKEKMTLLISLEELRAEVTAQGETALHLAARESYIDHIQFLIDNGWDINRKDALGNTAIHHACFEGHAYVIEFLHSKGADLILQNDDGWTPLHVSAFLNNVGLSYFLKSLDKKNVLSEIKDHFGRTPQALAKAYGTILQ